MVTQVNKIVLALKQMVYLNYFAYAEKIVSFYGQIVSYYFPH